MRRVIIDKMSVEMTGHSEACINRQDVSINRLPLRKATVVV